MKIAIYSRKSKFTGKGESIENQIKKCKEFIKFKFDIDPEKNSEIFIDEDYTGRNENRPQFKDMISKVKKGEIQGIVVYQLNRFGRNARDIHNRMAMCEEHNCIMYSATEGFDTSTSFGRAVMGILASLAQLETEQLAERIKDNMYTLAKMGRWLGGQSPLGFTGTRAYYVDENGKQRSVTELKKNDEELKLVKSIYNKYLEEKSLSQVSKWSLINNFRGKNGGNLDKSAINIILQNPVYVKSNDEVFKFLECRGYEVCGEPNGCGILRYGKESIAAVGKHKGIIDPDIWLEVQRILKINTAKAPALGKTNTALLTGILKCKCGSGMRVTYGHVNKAGIRPFYYTCSMKNNSGGTRCQSKNINGFLLEEKLLNYIKIYNKEELIKSLKKLLTEYTFTESLVTCNKLDDDIKNSNNSIKQLLNKLKLVNDDDITKIILNEMTYEKNKIKKLTLQKQNILERQSELSLSQNNISEVINLLDYFNENIDLMEFEEKKKILSSIFDTIIYDNNTFHIKYNVKKKLDDTSQFRPSSRSYVHRYPCGA